MTRWFLATVIALVALMSAGSAGGAVGDQVHQVTVPVSGVETFCSIGVAFDGSSLYYDRCGDGNIYRIDPITGALQSTFATGIALFPNALAFDATRNGLWIGTQACTADGMPIYFWDFDDNSVTVQFTIPSGLINPATGESFLFFCFDDGLAFNAGNFADPTDDELWFSDDINRNVGVFRPNGALVAGHDAATIDASLANTSGLAIGGPNLYLANDGGGDVFRANAAAFTLVDQFTSGDERQEDMECDPVTFAPTEVMWVRTTPQGGAFPDVITAYEIEPNTCGLGGGGPDTRFMTGGGSVFTSAGARVTHGFQLHCDVSAEANHLQVNWGKGKKFHLESLESASCTDSPGIDPGQPPSSFDTYEGSGTGRYNGVSGATATWTFTDAGEPGTADMAEIKVWDAGANLVLDVSGTLSNGNHQAHGE